MGAGWVLEGNVWMPLSTPATSGSDGRVVAIVDADGSPAAVGYDADGLAVWMVEDMKLIPVSVTGGDRAQPTSVTRSPDGRYTTTGYASRSSLISDDLVHWAPATSPTHWRTTNVDDGQVGAGFDYLAMVSGGEETSRTAVSMGLISDISASEDGVIVAAGASNDDYTGVLWIRGISRSPTVQPISSE